MVIAIAAAESFAGVPREATRDPGVVAILQLAAVGAWAWLATTAKRMRDIGLKPWMALPAWLVLYLIAVLVLKAARVTEFGFLLFAVFLLPLYLLPSRLRANDDVADVFT